MTIAMSRRESVSRLPPRMPRFNALSTRAEHGPFPCHLKDRNLPVRFSAWGEAVIVRALGGGAEAEAGGEQQRQQRRQPRPGRRRGRRRPNQRRAETCARPSGAAHYDDATRG